MATAGFFAACGGTDPDLLPTSTSSGTGGGGTGGMTGGSTTSTGGEGGTPTTTTVPEPEGPPKLRVLNGINDYDAIRVCFVPYPSGPEVDPWPSSPSGLAFGKVLAIEPPSSIGPPGADVQPFVIAGDLSVIAGKSCSEALALATPSGGAGGSGGSGAGGSGGGGAGGSGGGAPDAPPIVVSAMPVIPAQVFEAEKSLLLAFFGCIGGPDHVDGTEGLGCGFSFTPATPTANLTLVAMSRITEPDRIALQFVHASAAMQPSDVRVTPGFDNVVDVPVAKALALGGLGPKPPFTGLSRADYGSLPKVNIKTFAPNDTTATSTLLLQDTFTTSGIDPADFKDGSSYTFVAVGGYPGVVLSSFWHPFKWVMLPSDPP